MCACRIFCRARVSRLAIDASLTSRARATSGVVRPHSVRSDSATWVSGARLGWQQVKTSRSRSSSTTESTGSSSARSVSIAAASLSPRAASRRIRSTARRLATVRSQATGLSGTPSRGQVSSARSVASCTASSARARLPVQRVRVASTSRPDARTRVARVSVGSVTQVVRPAEVDDRSHLDGATPGGGDPGRPGDRLVEVRALEEVEAGERLLRLGVRAVGRDDVPALLADAHGGGRRGRVERGATADRRHRGVAELVPVRHLAGLLGRGPVDVAGEGEGCVLRHGSLLGSEAGLVPADFTLETNGDGARRTLCPGGRGRRASAVTRPRTSADLAGFVTGLRPSSTTGEGV